MSTPSPYSVPDPQQVVPPPTNSHTVTIVLVVCAAVLVLGLMCAGVLAAMMLPAVSAARDAARSAQVMNHMKRIGLAIHNYHTTYRQLPPAFTTDSSDTPLWSWRVTLMPFLEEQARWQQWNQDEPWDSAGNSQLHSPMPLAFQSSFESDPLGVDTHVFAVRHPDSTMSGQQVIRFSDVADGSNNTILAVYLPQRVVNWAAPDDITLEELQTELASASPNNSVMILFADGSVRRIESPLDPADVNALVTRNGAETIDHELLK